MTLRQVKGLKFPDIVPGGADMARPRLIDVDPTELLVDETYQRNLSERSRALIRRVVANWDWRAYKPPNVVETEDGLHVIDGQHTAIAAASNPRVGKIPVMIVDAPKQSDRASAFVRLNRDRINVTPTQMHHAMVAAGDDDAMTIFQVCERAGAKILRSPPGDGYWKVGDSVAVSAIGALVNRRHAMGARRVLEICVAAKMAPIARDFIVAIDALLFEKEYRDAFDAEDLTTILREQKDDLFRQAKIFALEHRTPISRGLTALLFRNVKKVRRGHRTAA